MLSTLITSKARRKILTLFLTHPEQKFYYNQIIRDLDITPSAVQNELGKLTDIGFLTSEKEVKVRYYQINKSFPLYNELKSIIYKTVGLADALQENLAEIEDIQVAFIYGSVAKNLENLSSDIDVMVIGKVSSDTVNDAISKAEESLGREVNYSLYSPADWKKDLKAKKAFVRDVAKGKKIFLIGTENDLRGLS